MIGRALCIAALIGTATSWATSRNYTLDYMKRAEELGLESGFVILEYSLNDDCDFGEISIVESSNPELYSSTTVNEIVRNFVGPFTYLGKTLPNATGVDPRSSRGLSFERRQFSWQNELGHELLECTFYDDGQFFSAVFLDSNQPPAEHSPPREIRIPLSELAAVRRKFSFRFEEGDS